MARTKHPFISALDNYLKATRPQQSDAEKIDEARYRLVVAINNLDLPLNVRNLASKHARQEADRRYRN